MISNEKKVESSVPVQSRISIVNLARLDEYWEREGVYIKTMSQLVSWSIQLLCEVLENNNVMEVTTTVTDARRRLEGRGLFQPSLKNRSLKRISTALAFENMRQEGCDPRVFAKSKYNMLHKKNTVEVPEFRQVNTKSIYDATNEDMLKEAEKILERRKSSNTGVTKEGMTYEDTLKFDKQDAELLKQQNKEMDELLDRSINKQSDNE